MTTTTEELIVEIAQRIYDKSGCNIYVVDVRGVSTMADFFIVAEGRVDRHVKALADETCRVIEEVGELELLQKEGMSQGDWVVLDFGEIVVHLLIPEFRERYSLEELWSDGKIVNVALKTGAPKVKDG